MAMIPTSSARGRSRRGFLYSPAGTPRLDRKSTRLNSSHIKNSYAVFCLKKKRLRRESTVQRHEKLKARPARERRDLGRCCDDLYAALDARQSKRIERGVFRDHRRD